MPDAAGRVRVFLAAAEVSGDRHAAGLAAALRRIRPDVKLEGVGGAAMSGAGVELWHESVKKARMGLGAFLRAGEVLGVLRRTRRRFREDGPPDLMVCCDSWTMNKHFLALAKEFGVKTLYYVSPQVWASRERRVERMRTLIDKMAVILPFEEAWLRERGLDATFVGHPLFDELPDDPPAFDAAAHWPNRPPVVALAAGSRRKVAADNFPKMLAVAGLIRERFPDATFVSPTVESTHATVAALIADRPWVTAKLDGFDELVRGCDASVCVSGTATLHTAALGVPPVVVYSASRFLWETVGRRLIKTRTFALVNWLSPTREHVVPEFVPWFGHPQPVAATVIDWLDNPAMLAARRNGLAAVVDPLRKKGASENAAQIVAAMLPPEPDLATDRHRFQRIHTDLRRFCITI